MASEPRRMARHTEILIGLLVGTIAGVTCNKFFSGAPALVTVQKYLSDPLGRIFLNMLIMVVIPLVFSSLALGVAQFGDLKQLGRMGLRTALYFFGHDYRRWYWPGLGQYHSAR